MSDTTATPTVTTLTGLAAYAAPLGRLLLASLFIGAGYGKITAYSGTAGYMASVGVSGAILPLVILVELGGGLLLALGWQTRLAALALAGFTVIASVLFHNNVADPMQALMFWKNLAITGGLLAFVANGAGLLSLDGRRRG